MQIFIDTNTYLGYLKSGAVLTALERLKALIHNEKIVLLVPQQTKDEVSRNIPYLLNKVSKKTIFKTAPPNPDKGIEMNSENIKKEKEKFDNYCKELQKEQKDFAKAVKEEEVHQEKAVKLINDLLSEGKYVPESEELINKAHIRYLKGNPPMKRSNDGIPKHDESFGDAITWECLLEGSDHAQNLTLISKDADYAEPSKDITVIHRLLADDWGRLSSKKIKLYDSLGEFINKFEGKQSVEKKVIDEEKIKPIDPAFVTAVWARNSEFIDLNNPQRAHYYQPTNGSYVHWSPSSTTGVYFSNAIPVSPIFCPFCGSNKIVDTKLPNYFSAISALYTFGQDGDHKCQSCGKDFSLK